MRIDFVTRLGFTVIFNVRNSRKKCILVEKNSAVYSKTVISSCRYFRLLLLYQFAENKVDIIVAKF